MYILRDRIKGYLQHPIFKRTIIYTITDGITKSISFIVLPIVSYFIVPSELGIAANFDVLQNIISRSGYCKFITVFLLRKNKRRGGYIG